MLLLTDSKYETLIVDSSYKVYMKLRIRNVTKEDFMQYKCVAKNSLGGSDGTITLYGTKVELLFGHFHAVKGQKYLKVSLFGIWKN